MRQYDEVGEALRFPSRTLTLNYSLTVSVSVVVVRWNYLWGWAIGSHLDTMETPPQSQSSKTDALYDEQLLHLLRYSMFRFGFELRQKGSFVYCSFSELGTS